MRPCIVLVISSYTIRLGGKIQCDLKSCPFSHLHMKERIIISKIIHCMLLYNNNNNNNNNNNGNVISARNKLKTKIDIL